MAARAGLAQDPARIVAPAPRAASTAAALAGFVAAAVGATWPVVRHPVQSIPGGLGDPMLCTVILAWIADRARHGFHAFWDAPYLFPQHRTLAYTEHLIGIALFTTPLEWLTGNPVMVYNLAFIASYALAGFGMFLLARALTNRVDAAWLGGLTFAVAPYRFAQTTHLQMLASGWMPIALLGLHRYLNGGSWRWMALFILGFLLTSLSSTYLMYFFLLPAGVVVAMEIAMPRRPRRRTLRAVAIAGAAAGIVLAPIGLVYYGLQRERGFVRPLEALPGLSARVGDYLHVPPGSWTWFGLLRTGIHERELFVGFVALAFACIGFTTGLRRSGVSPLGGSWRREIATYGLIAVLALWFSMGPGAFGPYDLAYRIVPGMSGLRVPARLAVIVGLAVSVLAAAGFAWVFERLPRTIVRAAAILLAAAIVLEGQHGGLLLTRVPVPAARSWDRVAYDWLRSQPPGGTLELDITRMNDLAPFTTTYQLEAVSHKHPIVNGYAGWSTMLQELLGAPAGPLREPGEIAPMLEGLRRAGVRYVLLHEHTFQDAAEAARIVRDVHGAHDEWAEEHRFGDTWVWRLEAPPAEFRSARLEPRPTTASSGQSGATLQQVDSRTLTLDASQGRDRLDSLVDGDIDTRWLTGAPQEGREWVSLRLRHPARVARVRLELQDRTAVDYPRWLLVEALDADGRRRVVFDGSVVDRVVAAAAGSSSRLRIDIDVPPIETSALTLRQTGVSRSSWSIHELTVFERR